MGWGEHDLRVLDLGFYDSNDKWRLAGGISIRESDGENIQPVSLNQNVTLEDYNSFFDIRTGNLSLAYDISQKMNISAFSSYDRRYFDARYFYTTRAFDKSVETVQNSFNLLRLTHTGNNTSWDIKPDWSAMQRLSRAAHASSP